MAKGLTLADFPELIAQWHPTKNNGINPNDVAAGSSKKYWWVCPKGLKDHEWEISCDSRTGTKKSGCPYCSNQKVCHSNCLATCFPDIAKEWHPTKNGNITPKDVIAGTAKKYWWKCLKGHEWQANCSSRTSKARSGCPCCFNQKICTDNCLDTRFPEVAKEWHPTKNDNITSKDVISGSNKKFWWECSKGHEWQANCSSRTARKSGCPYCSNKKVCNDNCLKTCFPEIAKEWHSTKNGDVTPKDVIAGSAKKYWWICPKGLKDHEWEASCDTRTRLKRGCPCCSNRFICYDNCLATCFPEIAKEWHPTKNDKITPKDVIAGSNKKYWWKCYKGHEWQSNCNNRTTLKRGCPCCSNRSICYDNCLETCFPEVAKEFHPTKNGNITPKDVIAGTPTKFWWKCYKEHEWQASCNSRTGKVKPGCPYCKNKKVCNNNCLTTCFPDIAKEFHPTKNGNITPKDVIAGSNKKYWWKCSKGIKDHEWQASCNNRTGHNRTGHNKTGCPYCNNHLVCNDNCLATCYPEIAKEWHPTKNNNVTPKDVTPGSDKKCWWICSKGHEWQTACSSRTGKQKCGCPFCLNSRGEIKISEFLDKIQYKYTREKRYDSCKNIKPLPFDFHVNNEKFELLIEYHGRQHYMPSTFGSKKSNVVLKNFKGIIKRDYIKESWCKENQMKLLAIPYWDYERIEEILTDFFAGKEIVFSEPPKEIKKHIMKRDKIIQKLIERNINVIS